jgi:hypothetical protein
MSDVDIERWADALIARHPSVDLIGHELVVIVDEQPDSWPRPGVRPMRSQRHPVDRLRRYRVPAEARALGLVCGGWWAPMDDGIMPSSHPEAKRIVQAVVMDRSGTMTGRVRNPDGSVIDLGRGGVGRVPDALRAALCRDARPRRAA